MADGKITSHEISNLGAGRRGVLEAGKVLDVLRDGRTHPFLEIASVTALPVSALAKIIGNLSESGQVKLDGKLEDAHGLLVTLKCGR